jgi:hypothetical protein
MEESRTLALRFALDKGFETPLIREFDFEENLRQLLQGSTALPKQ